MGNITSGRFPALAEVGQKRKSRRKLLYRAHRSVRSIPFDDIAGREHLHLDRYARRIAMSRIAPKSIDRNGSGGACTGREVGEVDLECIVVFQAPCQRKFQCDVEAFTHLGRVEVAESLQRVTVVAADRIDGTAGIAPSGLSFERLSGAHPPGMDASVEVADFRGAGGDEVVAENLMVVLYDRHDRDRRRSRRQHQGARNDPA